MTLNNRPLTYYQYNFRQFAVANSKGSGNIKEEEVKYQSDPYEAILQ